MKVTVVTFDGETIGVLENFETAVKLTRELVSVANWDAWFTETRNDRCVTFTRDVWSMKDFRTAVVKEIEYDSPEIILGKLDSFIKHR